MTNEQYRAIRGTHQPFQLSQEQAKAEWQRINKVAIAARRVRDEKHGVRPKFLGDVVDYE